VEWEVEYTGNFEEWWDGLSEAEQEDVAAYIIMLEKKGLALPSRTAVTSVGQGTRTCAN